METIANKIKKRYFRKVIAGIGIWHYGDCDIFNSEVCTCGLLLDLMVSDEPAKLYADFYKEKAKHDIKLRIIKQEKA